MDMQVVAEIRLHMKFGVRYFTAAIILAKIPTGITVRVG
jgi:hypothetical protein